MAYLNSSRVPTTFEFTASLESGGWEFAAWRGSAASQYVLVIDVLTSCESPILGTKSFESTIFDNFTGNFLPSSMITCFTKCCCVLEIFRL